jgi:hypothetical protein
MIHEYRVSHQSSSSNVQRRLRVAGLELEANGGAEDTFMYLGQRSKVDQGWRLEDHDWLVLVDELHRNEPEVDGNNGKSEEKGGGKERFGVGSPR